MQLTLTDDQEKALLDIKSFIFNDTQKEFLLTGESGSGKSTLVKFILDNLPSFLKPLALIKGYDVVMTPYLTATTNEAATILSNASGIPATTVHSFFKFRFKQNFNTGNLDLITHNGKDYTDSLIVIDECSMLDVEMRKRVNEFTSDTCKILYVGDSEQLDAIKKECDVFTSGLPRAHLTTNIRQSGNEIATLGLAFRDAVLGGPLPELSYVDSEHIKFITGPEMESIIATEFSLENYKPDRKILAFTNERVNEYNNHIREMQNGHDGYTDGEWLTTNNTIMTDETTVAKNNTDVQISGIKKGKLLGVQGHIVTVRGSGGTIRGVIPNNLKSAKSIINKLAKAKSWSDMFELQNSLLDLRPRFSSTVYKAQGGTLKDVYIDLNDISDCRWLTDSKKARALYVAITRAKSNVFFYGSL